MRALVLSLTLVVASGAAVALSARAEDATDPVARRFAALEARIDALKAEVDRLSVAKAEAADPYAERFVVVDARFAALKADADLLRAREEVLTAYLLGLPRASASLRTGVGQARTAGFENAAIPQISRSAVLTTLENLARDLSAGLPVASPAHIELRRRADELRRVWSR